MIVAGFGLSHYFFNRGNIGASVPLAYPPLLYLLARALWLGFREAQRHRAAAFAADHLAGGRDRPARRRPGRPQRRRLERDRRRLLGGDRRRPDRRPEADLRQLPRGRPVGRHLRAGRLLRLRPVRAGLSLERHLGRPARGPRGLDLLRPRDDGGALPPGPTDPAGPARHGARDPPLLRLGRLPVHRLRARVEHQRRAGRAHPGGGAPLPDLADPARDQPGAIGTDEVRAPRASGPLFATYGATEGGREGFAAQIRARS